jgi:Leucine-rich repeat (LRR) protein
VSHNKVFDIPDKLTPYLTQLETLDIRYNELKSIPTLLKTKELLVAGNPLEDMIPAYRNDDNKVCLISYASPMANLCVYG